MPVYIKKYSGNNYFQTRNYVDSLKLDYIPADGLPIFRFETEDSAGIGTYRAGDFDLNLSLLQSETSQSGKSIKEFFFGDESNCYYLVMIRIGSQSFTGIAQQSQIYGDYTYTQNKYGIKLKCKDILIEWAKRCETVPNSTINMGNSVQLTFEEYIIRHFGGISSNVVLINLPQKTYLNRLKELYSNIQWCYALGDYRNFITGQENISRWETFKELAKGLGFNFEMYLNPGTEIFNEPEFIFNIFFLSDLESETPITPDIIEISETITAPRLEWLFLKYRSFVFSEAEYSDGIFFNQTEKFGSDTNHGDGVTLYPTCAITFRNKVLRYINENQITEKTILKDVDFTEMPLKQYNYVFNPSIPIGKLFPLNEAQGGGMAYSRIFNCARVHGGDPDVYDFVPIQENAINNYKKYIKSYQHRLNITVKLDSFINYKLWLKLNFSNNNYIINSINSISIQNNNSELELINI